MPTSSLYVEFLSSRIGVSLVRKQPHTIWGRVRGPSWLFPSAINLRRNSPRKRDSAPETRVQASMRGHARPLSNLHIFRESIVHLCYKAMCVTRQLYSDHVNRVYAFDTRWESMSNEIYSYLKIQKGVPVAWAWRESRVPVLLVANNHPTVPALVTRLVYSIVDT
jgi:hypothetical protein